jgi:lysyl endopeptidase
MRGRSSGLVQVVALAVLLCLPVVSVAADVEVSTTPAKMEVPMEVATLSATPAEIAVDSARLSRWLDQERPAGVLESSVEIQLTQAEIHAIEFPEHVQDEPLKVGVVVPMTSDLRVQGLSNRRGKSATPLGGGILNSTADGGYVWAASIRSEQAGAIRVRIESFRLPPNAELFFYNGWGEVYGPFTGTGPDSLGEDGLGDFWTPSVLGSQGVLQLRVTGRMSRKDLESISFRVTELGHIGRGVFGAPGDADGDVAAFCPTNASCVVNAACVNQPIVDPVELAVAKMLWISGAFIYTCSGGLVNDTVPSTQIPYFLTANHCLSKNNSSLEAFFQYRANCGSTANCTGTWNAPPPGSFAGKTVGATVKATNRKGDFTLLQLNQNPPAGSVFLGWTNAPVANSNGVALYRISHPSGAPQSYSDQTVSTSAPTCQSWPRGERIYSRGVNGATEGGSSGSPVVNSSSQIVGQLSGACGTNVNNVCDNVNNATVDGAFAYYYNSVRPYLNP